MARVSWPQYSRPKSSRDPLDDLLDPLHAHEVVLQNSVARFGKHDVLAEGAFGPAPIDDRTIPYTVLLTLKA